MKTFEFNDHDLLIRIATLVEELRDDVKSFRMAVDNRMAGAEARLRLLEDRAHKYNADALVSELHTMSSEWAAFKVERRTQHRMLLTASSLLGTGGGAALVYALRLAFGL